MKLSHLLATDDPAAIDAAAWRTARSAIVELVAAAREYQDREDDATCLRLAAALAPFEAPVYF